MGVQVTPVKSADIWKSFLKVPRVTDKNSYCDTGFCLLECCSTFFQLRLTVRSGWFTLTDLAECALQLHEDIVLAVAHVCQYCRAHNEQYSKTSHKFAAHKLFTPQWVPQSAKWNDHTMN